MENRGLLFIPDISGFTRFVTATEIDHSRLIIQELLETLINANQIGLEVSEVEGDAILFYKFGDRPDIEKIYKQVEKMFCEFHKNILAYDRAKFCQCKACRSVVNLTLKVITHYGEFTGYNVKNFNKLIGKDVIVAHQLLKNDIPQHEYWLVTKDLVTGENPSRLADWMRWQSSNQATESGQVAYHYTPLSSLKDEITELPMQRLEISDKTKMFSVSKDYDVDLIALFHAIGDFSLRSQWQEGVARVEDVTHFLPRIGTRSRFITANGEMTVFASSYSFSFEQIQFSETDEGKKQSLYYTLDKINDKKTKLTIDFYIRKNMLDEFIFRITKQNRIRESVRKSMERLVPVADRIIVPEQILD